MSSSSLPSKAPFASAIVLATTMMVMTGCMAPRPANPPVKTVRVDGQDVRVACHCDADDDDDDDDADAPPPRQPVQYVTMADWQPPDSVKRIESEVQPRQSGELGAVPFPKLTLHQPIGETSVRRASRPYFPTRQR